MLKKEAMDLFETIEKDLESKKRVLELIRSSVIGEYIQKQAEDARRKNPTSSMFFYGTVMNSISAYHRAFASAYDRAVYKIVIRGNFSPEIALGIVRDLLEEDLARSKELV